MKRILDVSISLVALLVLLLPFLVLMYLVRRNLGSPIFFTQDRPGLNGAPFKMYKFRTMTNGANPDGVVMSDAERLTNFGRWLRATSLDELPELWNVLLGDMSLVGPRPLLMSYLPLYTLEQSRRHEVRPGITGLAQINGRNAIGWEEKFQYDLWYVDNHNLWIDLKIVLRTFVIIINHKDVNASADVTMPEFLGNKKER